MRIQDVMASGPERCCTRSDTAAKAARLIKNMGTGFAPVVENEQNRKLIGVVTHENLWLDVLALGRDPNQVKLAECMARTFPCCSLGDGIPSVVSLMCGHRVRCIPVVDENGAIRGIVSLADLVQCVDITH